MKSVILVFNRDPDTQEPMGMPLYVSESAYLAVQQAKHEIAESGIIRRHFRIEERLVYGSMSIPGFGTESYREWSENRFVRFYDSDPETGKLLDVTPRERLRTEYP